jgi:hypothetical protein
MSKHLEFIGCEKAVAILVYVIEDARQAEASCEEALPDFLYHLGVVRDLFLPSRLV